MLGGLEIEFKLLIKLEPFMKEFKEWDRRFSIDGLIIGRTVLPFYTENCGF